MSVTMIDETAVMAKVADLLDGITNVRAVYQGNPPFNSVYPCISVMPRGWSEEYADLRDTVENEVFLVTVFIQLDSNTLTAQANLRAIVKAVREVLGDQDNITLAGLIDSSRLIAGTYQFAEKESALYYCQLEYSVRKRFSRFSQNTIMNKYAYVGLTPVTVKGVGLVQPGQVITVGFAINNKLFESLVEKQPPVVKKKRN